MKIIAKLTMRHLLGNKKRSIVTILGIATATALIGAILLGVFSVFKFVGFISTQQDGYAQACFTEVTESQISDIKSDKRIATAGVCERDPDISGVRVNSGKGDRFEVGNIEHADKDYYTLQVVSGYEGTLPQNSGEIAVEEEFLKDNGLDVKVGDTLTFDQGYRYVMDEKDKPMVIGGSYRADEKFVTNSTESCTVTAILHGNKPTEGWDILRGMDETYCPVQENAEIRIALKKCDHTAIKQLKSIIEKYGISKYELNTEYLVSVFAFEGSGGDYRGFFILLGIGLIIVMVTSVILIVNSIGMSLTERMRYLGMLASVGATGRQKRTSIYCEGFILGIIGIPLGLLFGYIGTRITLSVLGARILATDMLVGAEGMRGSIPIVCAPWVICAIILCSAFTIWISVLVPAIKASKIMPIEALRESSTIKVSAKKLRVSPIVHKLFGYEGELAYKNIKRNGIKGTVITVTIAVSIVLFLTIDYLCNSIESANSYDIDLPYQLITTCELSKGEKLREDLSRMDGVDRVFSAESIEYLFKDYPEKNLYAANTDIADPDFLTDTYKKLQMDGMVLTVIDDADFRKLLKDNGLSEDKYFGDTLRGVLLNNLRHEKGMDNVFNTGIIGQSLHYDKPEGNFPAVEIGDFVKYDPKNYVFDLMPKGTVAVFVPDSFFHEKARETVPEENLTYDLGVVTSSPKTLNEKIYTMMEEEGYTNYSCTDMTGMLAITKTITLILKTVMYGFATLLTLIAVANIINTISTGVLLRRKEFAMYKSVGMASGGFKKMIRLETFLYGVRALSFGLPVSLFLSFLMYRAFDNKLYTFTPDLLMYAAVIIGVFVIVGLSMALSINKIKDDNIIEALKEDAV